MLNGVIDSFRTGTYTVTRTPPGTYASGILVPAASSVFPVDASIVPISGKMIAVEFDNTRYVATKTLYTLTELEIKTDSVEINGESFVVTDVKFWQGFQQDGSGDMYECQLARKT